MPVLLDLSNELLYKIIDQIHPNDILNFSLTCKDVYHVANDAVSLHYNRREDYTRVWLDGCHRHEENDHPLVIVREICMDWRCGEYIKNIIVECCNHPPDPEIFPEEEDEADTVKFKTEKKEDNIFNQATMDVVQGYIKEKVAELHISHRTCFDMGQLCSQAARGERSAMLSLVLLFTPNLEKLQLDQFSSDDIGHLEHTIHAIKQRYLGRRSRAPKPLMKLSCVKVFGVPGDPASFEPLMWFAGLPSMRVLLGVFTRGWPEPDPDLLLPPHTSNVKEILFVDSAVRANRIEQLLVGVKALQMFIYDHDAIIAGLRGMEAHKIIAVLHRHAKHSLESLVLWGKVELIVEESSDMIGKCLRGFKVLKELHISFWVYRETRVWYGSLESRSEREDVQPLVYSLPPSIEHVRIGCFPNFALISALFVDFAEKKDLLLPKLNRVDLARNDIEIDDEEWAKLEDMCGKVGVSLERPIKPALP